MPPFNSIIRSKFSLLLSIFLVINMIVGSGVFLNTGNLILRLGRLSPLMYLIISFLLVPIVTLCYKIAEQMPGKSLYQIFFLVGGKKMGKLYVLGYSIARFAGMVVSLLFTARMIANNNIFKGYNLYFFCILLFIILCMNMKKITITPPLQIGIFVAKIITLMIVIGIWAFLFSKNYIECDEDKNFFISEPFIYRVFSCVSFALFSLSGFESIFSFMNNLHESESKKSFIAILVGFISSVVIYLIYQTIISMIVAPNDLLNGANFEYVISVIAKKTTTLIIPIFMVLLSISSFGVSYGNFYGNTNNIFTLCKIQNSKTYHYVLMIITLILFLYAKIFIKKTICLQQIATLGNLMTYSILWVVYIKNIQDASKIISFMAIFSIFFLFFFFFQGITSAFFSIFLFYVSIVFLVHWLIKKINNDQIR